MLDYTTLHTKKIRRGLKINTNDIFRHYFEVRDNEIDVQGIVNNTNYMVYLGHARHKYIRSIGIDFNEYAARGHNFVLLDCTMQFKHSLKPDDSFYVTCRILPTESPIRFAFEQEIRLKESDQLILKAHLTATCINTQPQPGEKKIFVPQDIKRLLEK